jgi:hypothetical protein
MKKIWKETLLNRIGSLILWFYYTSVLWKA